MKFFYIHVLNKPWVEIALVKPPRTQRIPDIITIDEANRLFQTTRKLSYRVFFFTLYSMGLRLGEGLRLQVGDIDAKRLRVHIRNAKGNKDRLVPLPLNTLQVLRRFWQLHRHPTLLFPNRKRGLQAAHLAESPLDRGGVQTTMAAVVREMNLKKDFLSFATAQLCHTSAGSRCRSGGTATDTGPCQFTDDFALHPFNRCHGEEFRAAN